MPRSSKVYRNLVLSTLMNNPNLNRVTHVKEERKCLQCGKTHKQRGGFCSAECCKLHKEEHPPPI